MNESTFWSLIEKIDRDALQNGDEDGAVEPLIETLASYNESDIQGFEKNLAKVLYEIDGKIYADHAGESGMSGDGFLYARCYVVARGKEYYDSVETDPSKMPNSIDDWCESLLYVAQQAWAASTGNDEEAWDYNAPISYETGSNEEKWEQ